MNDKNFPYVIGYSILAGIAVCAPMMGEAGIVVGLFCTVVLLVSVLSTVFGSLGTPQVHHHFHHQDQAEAKSRPFTEGTERKALLPNGTKVQERIIRRYDQ